jgi:hypothetical protein
MNLSPITLPADWTPAQDLQSYLYRFDPHEELQDYIPDALKNVSAGLEELNETVDTALRYYQRKDGSLVPVHPGTVTLREKLHRLSTITNLHNENYAYKVRFAEHIHAALWVDHERERIMHAYLTGTETLWLHRLGDISDCLMTAAMELREGMVCEHDDYHYASGAGAVEDEEADSTHEQLLRGAMLPPPPSLGPPQ